jgi:hypothetical protein
MKTNFKKQGYSAETAKLFIDSNKKTYSLSTELEAQEKFVDKKPTGEIIAYKAWFTQEGLPPFSVKFENKIDLPKYLAVIEFENLMACEVKYNIYFKAVGIKEIK